jgi:cell wall-associated NlpC family hydrolase
MTTGSHIYYRSQQYEYLVIRGTASKSWVAVVLQNGAKGFIPTDSVAVLPYVVTGTIMSASRSAYVSRGPQVAIVPNSEAAQVAELAQTYSGSGIPYKWGGTDLASGIDCSAFVKKMFGAIGVNLPRTAAEQALVGERITRLEDLRAGDRLYFWSSSRNKIGHTGIYLGNGYFVHSSSGKGGVATSYLTSSWLKILYTARR